VLKAKPQLLNDWKAKLWSRFFCLSVYITMYLNDHQRSAFYESLGLDTRQFNQHVIIETNKSVARVFPQVFFLMSYKGGLAHPTHVQITHPTQGLLTQLTYGFK